MPGTVSRPAAESNTLAQPDIPSPDWVEELALNLAENLKAIDQPRLHNPLPARVKTLGSFLHSVYRHFDTSSRTEVTESYAAEWVLDNFYIIKQALRQINQNLPDDFYQRLPKVDLKGQEISRIYALTFTLTKATGCELNADQLKSFIRAFQNLRVLSIGELWALAPMLRLSILESLATSLAHITQLDLAPAPPPDLWIAPPDDQPNRPSASHENIVVNSLLSLRLIATQDWREFFENISIVEGILRDDPADVYARMDFGTRNRYRNMIEELSRGSAAEELEVARKAIELAQEGEPPRTHHVGYYLLGRGRPILEERLHYKPQRENFLRHLLGHYPTFFYLGSIIGLTVLLCVIAVSYAILTGGSSLQIILTLVLTALPLFAVAVDLVNWFVVHIMRPKILPRLDFKDGIPPEFSTMVVIPSLLKNERELGSLLGQLENHFLGNADPSVRFALLTDLVDAAQKELPGDAHLIAQAKRGIEELNNRYHHEGYSPFYLFHRERDWNPAEGVWMGWERKRGKLHQFNRLLRGESIDSFIVRVGDLSVLPAIRYVLTLDADTTVPRDSVHHLTGIFAHPLNQAEFDPETGAVVDGYTILQPRVQVRPTVANRSIFARVYSGDTTLDLYTRAVSDVYQDLFGEGSYVGKGMYDVEAFERSLEDRIPDNMLLSHDLFEGIHGRCGLVTDVVLFEDFPPHYLSYTLRLHRWVRGDWQLLPWLMPRVPHRTRGRVRGELSTRDRWKIFDNLRRSLTSPAILVLLIGGWLVLSGIGLVWTLVALSTYILAVVFGFIAAMRAQQTEQFPETTARPIQQAFLRSLFQVIFLPHEALVSLDAIATTLVRMTITRKRLLQWVTAAHTVQVFGKELRVKIAWNEMMQGPFLAVFLFLLMTLVNPSGLVLAVPFLGAWLLSPMIAVRISRRFSFPVEKLTPTQEKQLHRLARATWLYFEHFVGPDDHWLPPDHFQEEPRGIVAHRTSPTNIGLLLLSTLSAYDLGYIGPQELAVRVRNTFDGIDKLEKQRDHFLNWYDTRTLDPLPPRYISTVDSGNLGVCLIALQQGCMEAIDRPIVRWDGLIDTLDMLDVTLHEARLGKVAGELHEVIAYLRQQALSLREMRMDDPQYLTNLFHEGRAELEELFAKVAEASVEQLDAGTIRRLSTWIERARHHLHSVQRDMLNLYPWPLMLAKAPSLFHEPDLRPELASVWTELTSALSFRPPLEVIPAICVHASEVLQRLRGLLHDHEQEAIAWCDSLSNQLQAAKNSVSSLLEELRALSARAEAYVRAMSFGFLYDPRRRVFHIGYNVDSGRLDSSYYDLLASEARLTSLLAIAKGDVPQNHWLYLSRPITQVRGMRALLSWSGTMFEYLMPALLTKRYRNTLLDQSSLAAVEHQIAYGQSKRVPWGMSESAFYYLDAHQVYQYRAFGVPGLGYKRGLSKDLVITPYASLLALPFKPLAVIQNMERFQKLGMYGLYGLYEAIDFTAERLGTGQNSAIVRSYMAHHQGMILVSLCNHLRNEIMVQRFHADPRIETVKLLLQEDVPVRAPIEYARPKEIGLIHPIHAPVSLDAWKVKPEAPYRQAHFLSNGNYHLLLTAAGGGYSSWHDTDLTRWRADTTLNHYGTWIYIRDLQAGQLWSATHQPIAAQPDKQSILFYPHAAEFTRRHQDITTQLRISIAPDADVEIRRLVLTNHAESARDLILTSFAEVILASQSVDQRHPAYNRLFIESEYLPDENILLFRRRPRSEHDKSIYLVHFIVAEENDLQFLGYETDRRRFLGRGRTARDPVSLKAGSELSCNTATLDPVMALQAKISLPAYESRQVAFIALAASSRSEALSLANRYRQWYYVSKAFGEARTQAEHELMHLGLSSPQLERIQKVLSLMLYPSASLRSDPSILASNTLGQAGLWSFAISGDYPILLLYLREEKHLDLLNEVLRAHHYWRRRGLKIDLVLLNRHETSYDQNFQGKIFRLLSRTNSEHWLGKRGGIFVLLEDQMSRAEQILLATVARVVLDGQAGSLSEQLQRLERPPVRLPRFVQIHSAPTDAQEESPLKRPTDLLFDNGMGGFTPDGKEYVIFLDKGRWTPAPWTNVIANPEFGFLVTEAGMGCTWAVNSGENRLTPWHNDPVSDPPSEAIYLRDEDTGRVWSPTPLPTRADAPYLIRHGIGYSIFEHRSHGLDQKLKIFAAPHAPVKIAQLKLKNSSAHTRRLSITYYAEWVLGTTHENTAPYIVPEFASGNYALLASNPYNQDFNKRVAFLAATREIQGLTTDRMEFLGSLGNYARPEALERVGLTASARAGDDPCAAIQLLLWLAPGETKEVTFLLGQGADRADALRLINQYQNLTQIRAAWKSLHPFWEERIGGLQINTPDKAMDLLVNRWLPYQALSCRIWGRTAFYQSGGAYGFRDQLQDVMLFLYTRPEMARQHILEAARHQFEEGDVLHWWHPPGDRGIRTRITDNLLWLPYVTSQYVLVTGDRSILDQQIPFLSAEPLKPGEHERYGEFPAGSIGSLYEHCRRALAKGTTRGPHGLPLMGGGDWNDGMNNIGIGGTGESVWLGWFLYATLIDFARVCDLVSAAQDAARYRNQAEELSTALEAHAWDGKWYRRAYYDDGKPVGSAENPECKIDSISQSWAVISGAGNPERARIAMDSLYEHLVRRDAGLLLLLTPPFDRTIRDPGYIKGYLPGIRENGGQYTHAALWAIWAFAELGQNERVYELFRMINPIYDTDTPEKVERYFVEPYVIAADVYSHRAHLGHGGWTWYTGSASWMTRLVVEKVLGLRREGNTLRIEPCIPADWREYEIRYRFGRTIYHLRVENSPGAEIDAAKMTMDGKTLKAREIALEDDSREHNVLITLGEQTDNRPGKKRVPREKSKQTGR
ncbi:MAG TPA: glucoamylase family protein [Anaerolineales bacterium]|nr:glucoamylase family protein [Anaerolineales bacterium]